MAKCYYKLYDLQLVGIDYETYINWKLNSNIDNNHLYIVTTYNDNNYISNIDLYIGDTKLDANANEIYFETGENTGLTIQEVIEQLQAEFRAEDEEINSRIDAINLALSYLADKEVTTLPTISFSSSNVGAVEVGTTISPSYSIKFEDGKYEYGPEPTGSTANTYNVSFNGETKTTSSGTFSDITVNDSTSINLTATCNYTEGDIPLNNLGLAYPGGKITSGTTSQISKSLSGFRQVFFGSTTSSFNVDGVSIRNLKNSNVTKSSVSNFTMNIVDGAKQVLIAVPNNRKITAIEDKNAFGTDILAKFATSTLKVAGADENVDSEYARDYTVYIYSPDAALSSNTYTVRLANA